MRLRPEQLSDHLSKGLAPVYLISGDEPLLVMEAADLVRNKARASGFDERLVFHADSGFDFGSLQAESRCMSLFASRRLLDLRMPRPRPGREGSETIKAMVEDSSPDNLLLITTAKMDKATQRAAWARSAEQAGVMVQCWPVKAAELPAWLDRRMRACELLPEPAACRELAERVEGNLLAAVQEIQKLRLLTGPGPVAVDDIRELVADSARFEVFLMLDAALQGNAARALRMAEGLRKEAAPLPVIAAVLAREVRSIAHLRHVMDSGGNPQPEFRKLGVWESRKLLMQRAMRRNSTAGWQRLLMRCGELDRAIKGLDPRDPWQLVQVVLVGIAGDR